MFYTPGFAALCLLCLGTQPAISGGTWTPLANSAPDSINTMLLLPDGTVMAADANTSANWYQLTPDIHGSYINGTWSTLAPMNYTRLYYSSDVLPDGRVFVAGGEYGTGTTSAEVYNPVSNIWTIIPVPSGLIATNTNTPPVGFLDSFSVLLSNGKVLLTPVAPANAGETATYDPVANSWSSAYLVNGYDEDEATGVILPDNSIIVVDNQAQTTERYIPSLNQWIADASVPVALFDPYSGHEGAAFLLPNGQAFFIGSTPVTALYTPSGTTNLGTWAAGPSIPGSLGQPDAPAAMMVNGKVLCALSPTPTATNAFTTPTYFYEYDYSAGALGTFTQVTAPGGGSSLNEPTYIDRMLDLPDGTVLFTESGTQAYVYIPDLAPIASGQPTISSIAQNADGSYLLAGTQLNGISEGACYDANAQMNSNYPLIRMTNNSTGNVYYARTFNWSSTGVMTGTNTATTQFVVPTNAPLGAYTLVVVANGNASVPMPFEYTNAVSGPAQIQVFNGTNVIANNQTNAVNFGSVQQNLTGPIITFTVINSGGKTLDLASITVPSGYTLNTNYPSTIGADSSGTFSVQLNSSTVGTNSGLITIFNNDPVNTTFSFAVTGTVTIPLLITWTTPAPIVYGTALSSNQLDASANVPPAALSTLQPMAPCSTQALIIRFRWFSLQLTRLITAA